MNTYSTPSFEEQFNIGNTSVGAGYNKAPFIVGAVVIVGVIGFFIYLHNDNKRYQDRMAALFAEHEKNCQKIMAELTQENSNAKPNNPGLPGLPS